MNQSRFSVFLPILKWVINSICKRRARNYELQQTMQTHHAPRLEVEVLRFWVFIFRDNFIAELAVYSKNKWKIGCNVAENRIKQCFAANVIHSWQQYWTTLLYPIQL